MNLSATVEEIKSLIKEAAKAQELNQLIDLNLRISGYLIFCAEKESELLRDKLEAYHLRKQFEADFCLRSSSGVTKAELEATAAAKEHREKEWRTEYEYQKLRTFRSQVNEFTDSLRQKVAALRREKEITT